MTEHSRKTSSLDNSKTVKICGVCGDRAKSYHFGGISCDSCKAFFRRSVQNDAYAVFQCTFEGKCEITISSRKCCQFCRFQKCLSIGMEKSWVMSEEERLQMLRMRLEKRQREESKQRLDGVPSKRRYIESPPPNETLDTFMDRTELDLVEQLVKNYQTIFHDVPCAVSLECPSRSSQPMTLAIFIVCVQKIIGFAQSTPAFVALRSQDQISLLRTGIYEIFLVMRSNMVAKDWDGASSRSGSSSSETSDDDSLCSIPPDGSKSTDRLRLLLIDDRTLVLFLLVILFNPDSPGLADSQKVSCNQEYFCGLLRCYLRWKLGPRRASILFADLLLTLPNLRETKERRITCDFCLPPSDVEQAFEWVKCGLSSFPEDTVKFFESDNNNNECCSRRM